MKLIQALKCIFVTSIASLSKAWPGDDKLTKKECREKADGGDCEMMPDRVFMRENCPATCREPYRKGIRFYETGHQSFFDLSAKSEDGRNIDFERFEGSVTLVTDESSLCGFTTEHFQELHRIHKAFRYYMEVILFPTNQNPYKDDLQKCPGMIILNQSENSEFLTMETIDINGPNTHPAYQYLKDRHYFLDMDPNYSTFFIVSPDGNVQVHEDIPPLSLLYSVKYALKELGK